MQRSRELRDRVALGAFDISLNIHNNQILGWQIHLYMLIEGDDDKSLRSAVRGLFRPEPSALRPYDFTQVKDPLQAIT